MILVPVPPIPAPSPPPSTTTTRTKTIVNPPWHCSGMRKLHATIDSAIAAASSDIESDDNDHNAIDLKKTNDKLNISSPYISSNNVESTNGNNNHHHYHNHQQQQQIQQHPSKPTNRISEIPFINNSSTKCAKMTEEHAMIRNGSSINGVGITNVSSTPSPPLPPPATTGAIAANNSKLPIVINSNGQTTGVGGRLQFFKGESDPFIRSEHASNIQNIWYFSNRVSRWLISS